MTDKQFTRALELRKQMEELLDRDIQLSEYLEIIDDTNDMTSPQIMEIVMKMFDLNPEAARDMMYKLIHKISEYTIEYYNVLRKEFQSL
jgi:uncharacterized Zn finger protein